MEGTLGGAVFAAAFFALFQLSGLSVARLVLPRESAGVRLLMGSVWGSVMLQWFPVVFAFLLGFSPAAHGCALAVALGVGIAALWKGRSNPFDVQKSLSAFSRRRFLWIVGLVWLFIFDPNFGALGWILRQFGLGSPQWFLDPSMSLVMVIIVYVWKNLGYCAIVYLGGLQSLPQDDPFFAYQDTVHARIDHVASHAVIDQAIAQLGQDYRFQTAPHPIAELQLRGVDNTQIGRDPRIPGYTAVQ